jgi:heavy metal translocating P-type ATPase
MIGNSTQRRERLQAHVLPLHPNERAASSFPVKAGSGDAYPDLPLRLGLALFSWLAFLFLHLALHLTYFRRLSDTVRLDMPFVSMLLATPVVFYCGYPIFRTAARGLRLWTFSPESLLSLAALSAYFFGLTQTLRGSSQASFDTAIVLVTFFLAAKLIVRNAEAKTSRWIGLLHRALPKQVRQFRDGHEHFVSITKLAPGQALAVKVGECFVADGIVDRGESFVDESLFTGETEPVAKGVGDAVFAGTVNLDNLLFVNVTRTGADTKLARTITLLEQALADSSPLQNLVDRIVRVAVPAVALLAVATFGLCWFGGRMDFATALMRAIAILAVASPCALALATPLTICAALGAASRRGVLITDAEVLQLLRRVNHVVLDKTGAMTRGDFQIVACELVPDFCSSPAWMQANAANSDVDPLPSDFPFNAIPPSYEQTFSLLASLEKYSEHPLAKAIVAFAHERNILLGEPTCVEIHHGLGITGIVDDKSMFIGGRRLIDQMAIFIDARSELIARQWESEGRTVIFFGWDGGLQGCLAFSDSLRGYAFAMVAELKRRGIEPHLVSGDSRCTTEAVARQLGTESFRSEVLPVQKAQVIREWQEGGGVVAMVGDGKNDALALAKADLGMSMGLSPDLASPLTSVVLMDSDLGKIPELFELARKSMRVVGQNLFVAALFNTVGIVLAVTGLINPLFAAAAMLFSTFVVVTNSLRLNPIIPQSD